PDEGAKAILGIPRHLHRGRDPVQAVEDLAPLLRLPEHRPEARLALSQRLVGPLALADVAVDALKADRLPPGIAHHPRPPLERDHAAVLAEGAHLEERGRLVPGQGPPRAVRHALAIGRGHQRLPVAADQLAAGPAGQALVRAIDARHVTVEREGEDGVVRVVDDGAIALLALPEGRLGSPALGDVAEDAEMLHRPALTVPDEAGPPLEWHDAPVAGHRLQLEDLGKLFTGQRPADSLVAEATEAGVTIRSTDCPISSWRDHPSVVSVARLTSVIVP